MSTYSETITPAPLRPILPVVSGVPLSPQAYLVLWEACAQGESLRTVDERMDDTVLDDLTDLREGESREAVLRRIEQFVRPVDESRRQAWREYVDALCAFVGATGR